MPPLNVKLIYIKVVEPEKTYLIAQNNFEINWVRF